MNYHSSIKMKTRLVSLVKLKIEHIFHIYYIHVHTPINLNVCVQIFWYQAQQRRFLSCAWRTHHRTVGRGIEPKSAPPPAGQLSAVDKTLLCHMGNTDIPEVIDSVLPLFPFRLSLFAILSFYLFFPPPPC